jgi:hypothetical protein
MPGGAKTSSSPWQPHSVTCNPHGIHVQSTYVATLSPRMWIHVDPMTFNVGRGSQGHGGESWRPPMPPEPGDPTVCRAWPGVGTTFSNPLNTVQPGGSPDVPGSPSGRQPERRAQGTKPGSPPRRRRPLMDSRDHCGSESMRVTPADTEPSTKPGSKPPQRARRSSAPSLVYPLRSERARPDGRDHIQLHAVHIQSTFSSHSVHIQFTFSPRTWIHVDPMAFNVEGGSQGHGGESRRPPMPPERGDPTVYMLWSSAGNSRGSGQRSAIC